MEIPSSDDPKDTNKKEVIFPKFTKYANINGPKIRPGNLNAVNIAFVLPASPTFPISTEILLCDVTNVPEPNPAKINIRFWNVKGFNINSMLAIKWKNNPQIYVVLNPNLEASIGTIKLPILWLINNKVTHIPIFAESNW